MTTSPLTDDFIARQRARLEALRADLIGSDREATALVRESTVEQRETAGDVEDAAQGEIQEQFRQSLQDLHSPRLAAIERALAKIDEGTYGLSDESDEPIPRERLEAVPEATLTIDEAEARDRAARIDGPR